MVPAVDVWATSLLHDVASPPLDALMSGITGLGSSLFLAALVGLSVAWLALRHHTAQALFVGIAFAGSVVLNDVLKLLFARARPVFDWADPRTDHAFPTGHAMNSLVVCVALALIAWQLCRRRSAGVVMVLSFVVAILVRMSRVYLGAHWLTDVLGGFLAGILWLLIVSATFPGAKRLRGLGSAPPGSALDPPTPAA